MIAIAAANGGLIRVIPESGFGQTYGFHRLFGFISERAYSQRIKNRKLHGLRSDSDSDWLCRFAIVSRPETSSNANAEWALKSFEGCEARKSEDGSWRLITAFGNFLLSNGAALDSGRFGSREVQSNRTIAIGMALSALLMAAIPFLSSQKEEVVPPPVLEPMTVKIIQEAQKSVPVSAPPSMKNLTPAQIKEKQVRRAVQQNLGFLGILGKKDLSKALGGMPTQLKDASAGAGAGGKRGSGGELLVGLGQGVKRTTVGNSGTVGLGGVGTKGAGGGAGGYGNALVGSGEGRNLSTMPLSKDIVLEGGLDRAVIQATIAKYISQVRACYEAGLQKNPGLSGQVTMNFEIGPSGMLNFSRVAKSSMGNAGVEQCISQRMMSWQFPKPLGGVSVKVTYPFLLRPVSS